MNLLSCFAHTHRREEPGYQALWTLPLDLWAGHLPATGEGLRAALTTPRHLWAIGRSFGGVWLGGWEIDPLLPQLSADVVRGEIEIAGLMVPVRSLLTGAVHDVVAAIDNRREEALVFNHAYRLLRDYRVHVYHRNGPLSEEEATALAITEVKEVRNGR